MMQCPLMTQSGHASTMRTARPTTGSPLSISEAGTAPFDPASSCFCFFRRLNPANPFITHLRAVGHVRVRSRWASCSRAQAMQRQSSASGTSGPKRGRVDVGRRVPGDVWRNTVELVEAMSRRQAPPPEELLAKGPQIVEAVAGGPLRTVKPYTREVRAEIDTELVSKSIDFMKRQTAAGKPFFLYLPFSMGHFPNLPSKQFAGKSRIGQYGDKLMEGDYHVGQILDALKELGVDNNTLLVFASDNGPQGETSREMGNQGSPDMGNSGPFRGELGEATEGSIRTFCIV